MMFGGGMVPGGTLAMGGAAGKLAVTAAAIGTATTVIAGLAAVLAPAVAGIWSISRAYDPAFQASYRDKLLAEYRAKQAAESKKIRDEDARRIKLGMGPKFQSLEYSKGESWQQYHLRKKIQETGVNLGDADLMKSSLSSLKSGDIWGARSGVATMGTEKFERTFGQMSEYDLKLYGLSKEQVDILRAIAKASSGTIEAISKGWQTTINLDGRQIAVVTAQTQQGTKERSGRPVEAGARSRAIRTGNP